MFWWKLVIVPGPKQQATNQEEHDGQHIPSRLQFPNMPRQCSPRRRQLELQPFHLPLNSSHCLGLWPMQTGDISPRRVAGSIVAFSRRRLQRRSFAILACSRGRKGGAAAGAGMQLSLGRPPSGHKLPRGHLRADTRRLRMQRMNRRQCCLSVLPSSATDLLVVPNPSTWKSDSDSPARIGLLLRVSSLQYTSL